MLDGDDGMIVGGATVRQRRVEPEEDVEAALGNLPVNVAVVVSMQEDLELLGHLLFDRPLVRKLVQLVSVM